MDVSRDSRSSSVIDFGLIEGSDSPFWKIDTARNDQNMATVLVRNINGSKHKTASKNNKSHTTAIKTIHCKVHESNESNPTDEIENHDLYDHHFDEDVVRTRIIGLKDALQFQISNKNLDVTAETSYDVDDDYTNASMSSTEQALQSSRQAVSAISLASSTSSSSAALQTKKVLQENIIFSADVEIITIATTSSGGKSIGVLSLSKTYLSFIQESENELYDFENKTGNSEFMWCCKSFPSTVIEFSNIIYVTKRRYLLRNTAVEVFLNSRQSVFVNLKEPNIAIKFYKLLKTRIKLFSPFHKLYPTMTATTMLTIRDDAVAASGSSDHINETLAILTNAWRNREITNFDYLMHLNSMAGRTFSDLAQYPVFPWVLADYSSEKLDLKNSDSFRNFKWPIGAQTNEQRVKLNEKYENLQCLDDCLPYHFGSHYSSSSIVLWYLLRLEPYTSYHIWLQNGRFDRPDRLFYSIETAYHGCTTNLMDSKELIPEFFCNPEFLENINGFELGVMQDGHTVGNVRLPPWAKNSHDFVRMHHEALESDYVSMNLHHWIDLIFGYKQCPPFISGGSEKAVEASNVFMHLTYANSVNLDEMQNVDPNLYNATIKQIENFGQTPTQLFTLPHPQRLPIEKASFIWPIASIVEGVHTAKILNRSKSSAPTEVYLDKPEHVVTYEIKQISSSPILFIYEFFAQEKLITIDSSRCVGTHSIKHQTPDIVPPYFLKADTSGISNASYSATKFIKSMFKSPKKMILVGIPFALPSLLVPFANPDFRRRPLSDLVGKPENKVAFLKYETERVMRHEQKQRRRKSITSNNSFASDMTRMRNDSSPSFSTIPSSKSYAPSPSSSPPMTVHKVASTVSIGEEAQFSRDDHEEDEVGEDEHLLTHLFAIIPDSKLAVSCGHIDNSFQFTSIETGKVMQSVVFHQDIVTCIAVALDYNLTWLITGSRDYMCMVWEVNLVKDAPKGSKSTHEIISDHPLHVLSRSESVITCIAVNAELDLVCSGSEDGTIHLYSLRHGSFHRKLNFGAHPTVSSGSNSNSRRPSLSTGNSNEGDLSSRGSLTSMSCNNLSSSKRCIHLLSITKDRYIIAYSHDGTVMCSYAINGRLLRMIDVRERLYCMIPSEDGKVILTGGDRSLVVLRWASSLGIANNGPRTDVECIFDGLTEKGIRFESPIRSLYLSPGERLLYVGLESGELGIISQDSEYLRRRLHRRLVEVGIVDQLFH